jgi:hypothetical protein
MIQPFRCTNCGIAGEVLLDDDASILQAVNKIKAAHNELSPNCEFDNRHIIVCEPTLTDDSIE